MSNWATELPAAIRAALEAAGGVIVVDAEAKAELGRRALGRMAPEAAGVTFQVSPEVPRDRLA